jgi:hypothetical protein
MAFFSALRLQALRLTSSPCTKKPSGKTVSAKKRSRVATPPGKLRIKEREIPDARHEKLAPHTQQLMQCLCQCARCTHYATAIIARTQENMNPHLIF